MESSAKITAAVFAAHLRCPTEARLLMRGETPSHTFFSDIRKKISAAQRTKFETADLFGFSEFMARPESQTGMVLIDSLGETRTVCQAPFTVAAPERRLRLAPA